MIIERNIDHSEKSKHSRTFEEDSIGNALTQKKKDILNKHHHKQYWERTDSEKERYPK